MTLTRRRRSLTPEERKRARRTTRRENKGRAGSPRDHDRRVSPRGSIEEDQFGTNSVSSRALKTDGSGDQRAVTEAAGRTGLLSKRWFGAADNPDLTDGVMVPLGRLRRAFENDRIAVAVLPGIDEMNGSLGPDRVPRLERTRGAVDARSQIDWGSGRPVPAARVGRGYSYWDLDDRPNLKQFLTRSDFKPNGTLKK